jgi:hypothetical protein
MKTKRTVAWRAMPVCVAVEFAKIDGHVVAFYEGCSQVVDYRKVRAWVDKSFPQSKGHTDATNFGHCLSALREIERVK